MGGGGVFCTICFLPLSPCSIFSGVIAQHPNRSVPKMLSGLTTFHVMKEFGYICITRVVVVVFFTLPSEFQVIISGSKKQQQKDSYQSEVPFSVIPGRTP